MERHHIAQPSVLYLILFAHNPPVYIPKDFTNTPVVVEYELSDYAETLHKVLDALSEWGAMHRQNIKNSMTKKQTVGE